MADRIMKAAAPPLAATDHPIARASRLSVLSELVKARLTFLVLLTTAMGFYLGSTGKVQLLAMVHALAATGLLACGAAALNQWMEREFDAKMKRTESRPVPSGKISPDQALLFGALSSISGLLYLAWMVNLLTAVLGILTLVSYVFIYTPLKRITPMNTLVGAVPGALPPLMGWTAAHGSVTPQGWALFAILFFWQLPHFLAIAWLYREDYERAGFKMLPSVDPDGRRTGRMAVSHALGLFLMSLFPFLLKMAGPVYLVGAVVSGCVFVAFSVRFFVLLNRTSARHLFIASIVYLPLISALLVLDKLPLPAGL